jgi:hypothetical protein
LLYIKSKCKEQARSQKNNFSFSVSNALARRNGPMPRFTRVRPKARADAPFHTSSPEDTGRCPVSHKLARRHEPMLRFIRAHPKTRADAPCHSTRLPEGTGRFSVSLLRVCPKARADTPFHCLCSPEGTSRRPVSFYAFTTVTENAAPHPQGTFSRRPTPRVPCEPTPGGTLGQNPP